MPKAKDFFKCLLFIYVHVCFTYVYVCHVHVVLLNARRGHQILLKLGLQRVMHQCVSAENCEGEASWDEMGTPCPPLLDTAQPHTQIVCDFQAACLIPGNKWD